MIREYDGYSKLDVNFNAQPDDINIQEAAGDLLSDPISASSLMVDIEGIHAYPHATRNFTRYMPECLKKSVPSWTKPYRRPLIKHHNEKDGEIIGRICAAEYVTNKTLSGTPALLFTANVPGTQAKADIQDGILETVSIGIIAHDVRCSICGHQIAEEGPCQDHDRGQVYKTGKVTEVCYWDIHSMEAKELSYVIVPSDIYGKNVRTYPATSSKTKSSISESANKGGKSNMVLTPEQVAELQEQLAAANTALTEATATHATQVATLTESNTALEAKVTELTATNTTLTEANVALTTQTTELTEGKTALEGQLAQEVQMREGLENEMVAAKAAVKVNLVETVQAMRKATGKVELTEESIKTRSEDSLRDAIADLKEELKPNMGKPGSLNDPTLQEKDENKDGVDVKEKNSARNIDLEEGLQNLFKDITNARK